MVQKRKRAKLPHLCGYTYYQTKETNMKYILSLIILIINVPVYASTYHPADTNKDWQISHAEFQAYNTAWKHSQDWPEPPNPIPGMYAARAGYLYKKGNCYHVGNADAPMKWMTDMDCDGSVDIEDQCPEDPNKIISGFCGCGVVESDSDKDNTPDCVDGCPNDPNKIEPGICGCGVVESDSDNDNTPDCVDACPNDPNKIEPGICGCGNIEKCTFTNSIGMSFVPIEPGTFMMGSPSDESGRDSDETQHQVTLTKGYFMQTTEVTQGQWKEIMGSNPSDFSSCGDNCPVERVSWNNIQEFIQKLNQKESGRNYRLPTEAEWEYAARAGTTTRFFWGNQADCSRANYGNSSWSDECKSINPGKTKTVKSYSPNNWGLYDMHGNVWEWCNDWYVDYNSSALIDPVGPTTGASRVVRGGSWCSIARDCRSANRYGSAPDCRGGDLGFRLVAP
jgi:formylglycine-generating enzyme required for sulfatase activity